MSYYHDDDGSDEETIAYAQRVLFWTVVGCASALAVMELYGWVVSR